MGRNRSLKAGASLARRREPARARVRMECASAARQSQRCLKVALLIAKGRWAAVGANEAVDREDSCFRLD